MKTIVVASSVDRAKHLAREFGYVQSDILAGSPQSICRGAGRGIVADLVLIDESAWPLGEVAEETLRLALAGGNGQMYRMERVLVEAQRP